jgi:hypothetical protein
VWWHWVNGNVTKEGIEKDLADMKRVGIAGVQMFDVSIYLPPGPVRYGSEMWHEHVQHAMRTAERHGLEFHLMNTPGWSASGGPWVTPERSMKRLVWSETPAAGGAAASLVLPQPEIPALKFRTPPRTPQRNFYRDIVVLAVPAEATRRTPEWEFKTKLAEKSLAALPLDTDAAGAILRDRILDLTASFDPATGRLRATLPPGSWSILRFGFTSTGRANHPAVPEGHGLEIDKLDASEVSFYFDQALGRILRDAGPLAGRTFKGILFDSFEGGPQNWTDTFPAQFRSLKGYDILPLLPVLTGRVVENTTFTECVLRDFRGAVEELIARNYFGTMRRRAHEHGLVTYSESQGGPLNPVSSNEHVDIPMNEFWMPDAAPRFPRIKLVASVASVLGRPIVAAEAFTATPENGRWQNVPSRLKVAGDGAWTAGINRFILHHYTHQPTDDGPGFGLGRYGTNFGRLNTWWPLASGWVEYVSRGQFLLQQGVPVADIAFLQNEDHGYAFPAAMTTAPAGYDFDIVYPRHLRKMRWQEGAFVLPTGPKYRLLVLPENWAAEIATLRTLRELARAGAPIVGSAPVAPAGRTDFTALREYSGLIAELWGGDVRRPLIRSRSPIEAAVHEAGLRPDVEWPARTGSGEFRYVHRRTSEADIYFVFNHSAEAAAGDVAFRIRGRQPELWNAMDGSRHDAPVYRTRGETTVLPLQLEPHGSIFVVFRRPLPDRWIESVTPAGLELQAGTVIAPGATDVGLRYNDGQRVVRRTPSLPEPLNLSGSWRVEFAPDRGAPPDATLERLIPLNEHADDGIRFYSGVATYRTTFVVPAGARQPRTIARLDLGSVGDLAEVRLNGVSAGNWWQPPFQGEITPLLRPGENTLEIRVANRWINRLIGDERLPTDLTYQKTGTNKFTDGKLEHLPAWLYDASRRQEKRRISFATWKHYNADSTLVPSGLIGPVRIEWRAVVEP